MREAKGVFEITAWDEQTYEELPNGGKLSQARVTQRFTGDVTGDGSVVWVMGYPRKDRARFVGMQRIVGDLGGKRGSFLIETIGLFDGTLAKARWSIVEGSGTDDLTGIKGEGSFEAPHGSKADYRIAYELPEGSPG